MTDVEAILQYVKEEYGTEPDRPWERNPENMVLRHKDNRKWYALIMPVSKGKLGLSGDEVVEVMNVKCDPGFADIVRDGKGILPAYHMNHTQWLTILLDGTVKRDTILDLLDMSYSLTASKKKRRLSADIDN